MPDLALPPATLAVARAEADAMAGELTGVRAVVIATPDGFDVASAVRGDLDPSRIAALASSIAAIGEVVSREAGLGRGTSVTVNTDDGFAVVHAVPGSGLVINVLARGDAVLAQVHYRAAEAARRLARA